MEEQELDFGYAEGFLAEWLKAPKDVAALEHLKVLAAGIEYYRKKLAFAEQDLQETRDRYNALVAQSAQYLELMRQQKELLDQTLMDQQREFHTKDRTEPKIEI